MNFLVAPARERRRIFLVPRGRRKLAPRRRRSRDADPAPGFRSWKRGGGRWRAGEFLAGFGRLRGERRRGSPDLPEPSGEGGEGGRSAAAIGGAAPGRQVASKLRGTGLPGILKEGWPPGEEWKSPGARAGSFGDLVEHGGGCSTWRHENWPHSGRKSVLSEAVQPANITWDTFFAFRVLVPFFLRRRPHSDRWISREGFGVYYGFSKLRGMKV